MVILQDRHDMMMPTWNQTTSSQAFGSAINLNDDDKSMTKVDDNKFIENPFYY